MDKIAEYYLRGTFFLYTKMTACEVIRWKEEVSVEILQEALNAVINKSPWLRISVDREGEIPALRIADCDFTVYSEYKQREYPQVPGGFLFSVTCEKNKLFLEFDHFLTDGYGFTWLENEVLSEYCLRKYGTCIPQPFSLSSSSLPPYDELINKLRSCVTNNNASSIITGYSSILYTRKRILLRIEKRSFVERAIKLEVKPTALFTALICYAVMQTNGKTGINYSFAFDSRSEFGISDAFIDLSPCPVRSVAYDTDMIKLISFINKEIKDLLSSDGRRNALRELLESTDSMASLNSSYYIKKMAVQTFENASSPLVSFSYLGNLIQDRYSFLKDYIVDNQAWSDRDNSEAFVLERTLGNQMIISISHRLNNDTFINSLKSIFRDQEIEIIALSNVDLNTYEEEDV